MGIKYGTLSPEPIHVLVGSGLCIYRSKLRSYNGVSNIRALMKILHFLQALQVGQLH